jgi:uncharacterized SAM-binding protein YcdF (DUF218 family)
MRLPGRSRPSPLRPSRLTRLLLCVALAAAPCLLAVLAVAWRVDRFGHAPRGEGPVDVAVVLGARVRPDGTPSSALASRVERAVELHRAGLAPRLLFSGGVGTHPPSEARAARELAVALGVPAEACLLEEESRSTRENAERSAAVLRQLGARRVRVVSEPYHLLRARQYFRLQGLEVETAPTRWSERDASSVWRAWWSLREAVALLVHPEVLWARPAADPVGPAER